MTQYLFDRQCTVQMGTVKVDKLRVQFKIEKQETELPGTAEIKVWNLSRDTRNKMVSQGIVPVILMAGYAGNLGLLFNGDILPSGIGVERSGPDWITEFKVGDGLLSHQTDRIQMPFSKGTAIKDVLAGIIGQFKGIDTKQALADLKSGKIPLGGMQQQLQNGTVASGRSIDELKKWCKTQGIACTVVDGHLELAPDSETSTGGAWPQELVPDLTPKTGLIGSPEPTKDRFVKLKCLLRPEIKPNRRIKVSWSIHPMGLFVRALKVTHTGDTRGQEWYTEVEGRAL